MSTAPGWRQWIWQTISKQDLSGKVVVLSFFGTWCAPCIAEMAEFINKQEYKISAIPYLETIIADTKATSEKS